MVTSSKLKKKEAEGVSVDLQVHHRHLSLDHFSPIKTEKGEGEVKFCTLQPGLIAAAFSTIILKATAEGEGC